MITRRQLLGGAAAATAATALPLRTAHAATPAATAATAVLTTDLALDGDMDDWYDVACFKALGGQQVALDHPTIEMVTALHEVGLIAVHPMAISQAAAIISVGSPYNAAWWCRQPHATFALFAGDADGQPGYVEWNERLHPVGFQSIRLLPSCRWVPCFAGGPWRTDGVRASWTVTDDHALLDGLRVRSWFERWRPDRLYKQPRNLWVGPLLQLAWRSEWRGHTAGQGGFRANPATFPGDMVDGTRELLAQL